MREGGQRGAATVEQAGVTLLVALALLAAISAIAAGSQDSGRDLASTLGRKLRCAAVGPGPCWRDPLTLAYGRAVAGAVRALAPLPAAEAGPLGPELPVDFRRCRTPPCAAPGPEPGRTATGRAVTAFTEVERPAGGGVAVTYWLYRPRIGWRAERRALSADGVERLARTPLLDDAVPALVALETLDGRNQLEFPAAEEPPWRWRVESVYP